MAIHEIELIYNAAEDTVISLDKGLVINKGDGVHFSSAAGPVRVLMIPNEQFSAAEFRTGDNPLVVGTDQGFQYCCGVTVNGKVVGYPEHRRFGSKQPPPGDDGGSTDPHTPG